MVSRAREITNEIETRGCGIKIKRGCVQSPLGLRNGKPGLDLSTARHISSNPKIRKEQQQQPPVLSFLAVSHPLSETWLTFVIFPLLFIPFMYIFL